MTSVQTCRVLHVVGTRPNFMKVAPVMAAAEAWDAGQDPGRMVFDQILVHTGQHYDSSMSSVFFEELGLPEPDVHLGVGSGSHGAQTARLLEALESALREWSPRLVVTVGDVNSTLAATLAASKLDIPVAHVEAGLRSDDRRMPEEVNRLVADRLARLLFTTSRRASERLVAEGVAAEWVHFVGNTMIDCLERLRAKATRPDHAALRDLGRRDYAVVTLHRPSNVDDIEQLRRLSSILVEVSRRLPVVFPVHVRTEQRLREAGQLDALEAERGVLLLPPVSYLGFLGLVSDARIVLTDSGGIQAETCVMGTPCLTLRTTTEWVETIEAGVNRLVDPTDGDAIIRAVDDTLARPARREVVRPELWDGHAAERIVAVIAEWAQSRGT